ncbi:hypothetical protein GCM10029964_053110 [Kibdelosporangium lantanae]
MSRRVFAVTARDAQASDWTVRVAQLTRDAFAAAEEMAGLPTPDGAGDDATALRAELSAGATMWVAVDGDRLVGSLRVDEHPDGSWEVRRIAVSRQVRRSGITAALLAAAERAAAASGVRRVWLNAVVERGLPPIYARLGYRAVDLEPGPGKPLSELVMRRAPAAPRVVEPLADGWVWPARRLTVSWFLGGGGVLAVAGRHNSVRGAVQVAADRIGRFGDLRIAGVDADTSPGTDRSFADFAGRLGGRVLPVAPDAVFFPTHRADVPGHVMPRTVDPDLFAVWRYSPGHEPAVAAVLDDRAREETMS